MDNQLMPYEDWLFVNSIIAKSRWIFAKTMPQNPHYYMLRKESNDDEFVRFVKLIREYGYRSKYGKSWYILLNVNNCFYWTMGCPLHNCNRTGTILINRKERKLGIDNQYDEISEDYEKVFYNDVSADEDVQIAQLITRHNLSGRILEIGCGSGMVTRNLILDPDNYVGVDPSEKMLNLFNSRETLKNLRTVHTDFESYADQKKFNFMFATYGAASYVRPEFWTRINSMLERGGTFFLMFYADNYMPVTHIFSQVELPYYSANDFPKEIEADIRTSTIGNYVVMEGIKR